MPRWATAVMSKIDLPDVIAIEGTSYRSPWPLEAFQVELNRASWAHALVLRDQDRPAQGVRGYVCFWTLQAEMCVHNIAVHPDDRRLGGASHLLAAAWEEAVRQQCRWAYLEVRPSNEAAISLYSRWGFEPMARRLRYYEDTGEDAIIMRAGISDAARSVAAGAPVLESGGKRVIG